MNTKTKIKRPWAKLTTKFLTAATATGLLAASSVALAADHKDTPAVLTLPAGDITDYFAFVDPNQTDHVVLMFGVNPFINPSVSQTNSFEESYLYQIKIDNDQSNGLLEDLVIQVEFDALADRGAQTYSIKMGTPQDGITGPLNNKRLTDDKIICTGTVFTGLNFDSFDAGVRDCGTGQVFAGVTDDSFSLDVSQFIGRVGINPDPVANAITKTQDVPRGMDSPLFGDLRGRPLRIDENGGLNSGAEGVGGFDIGTVAVSIPTSSLRGAGFPDPSQDGVINSSLISSWITVSRAAQENFDGFSETGVADLSEEYNQFDRNGHQFTATVFGFQQPTLNAPEALSANQFGFAPVPGAQRPVTSDYPSSNVVKDLMNATGPEDDLANFGYLFPDTILFSDLVAATSINTIQGRRTILTAGGFTASGIGTPLIMPSVATDSPLGRTKDAYRQLVLPDTLRLNLDIIPDTARPGAAAAGNADEVLSLGRWGLQNGRRPADDVLDIFLRLARENFDVKFPDNLVVQGMGITEFPGSQPLLDRRAWRCENLNLGIAPVLGQINSLEICEDTRVFLGLQGTDWHEPTQADVNDVSTQVQLRTQEDVFPYVGRQHPFPGEAGSVGFPDQHENDL